MIERTRQQRDPTGTLGSNATGTALVVIAVVWALVVTVAGSIDPRAFGLQAVSLFLLMAAAALFVWSSTPFRAPLRRSSHALILGLAVAAVGVSAAATWQTSDTVSAGWASVSIGLFIVALAPYRPAAELFAFSLVPTLVIGGAAFLRSASFNAGTPRLAVVVAAVVPLVGLSAAATRYTNVMLVALEQSEERAGDVASRREDELRADISLAVQRNRATILGREVAPFFERLLERKKLTDDDRQTARTIAESIRDVMIADADRSWLEAALLDAKSSNGVRPVAHDPDALATAMDPRQRTALRALAVAIIEEPAASTFSIELSRAGDMSSGIIRARVDLPESVAHAQFDPFLAVMRIVFSTLAVEYDRPNMIVRFSFVLS